MARALLGEREALLDSCGLPAAWIPGVPDCFWVNSLTAKPHYADRLVTSPEGWMVWTYLPSGDPFWVADCPTYTEANALAEALSAPTLFEVHHA
jgi:hypothetical protein